MENVIFLEDLNLNRDRRESINEISVWLRENHSLRLRYFINSGGSLVGVCATELPRDSYNTEDISNQINSNINWI